MRKISTFLVATTMASLCIASAKDYTLTSPDGKAKIIVATTPALSYSISVDGIQLITPSEISLTLTDGRVLGADSKPSGVKKGSISTTQTAQFYRTTAVEDNCNTLTVKYNGYQVEFRAYNDSFAYRFITSFKKGFKVKQEQQNYTFAKDWKAWIPYVRKIETDLKTQYFNSFENTYTHENLSSWVAGRIAFTPLTVDADNGIKVLISESDLLNYPGSYLEYAGGTTLRGINAPYPKEVEQGGHNMLQGVVKTTEDYIATYSTGAVNFPWRIVAFSRNDKDLMTNHAVWRLATPATGDFSWVKPGKVAWEWWNYWNIKGVDFKAGINTETYKFYIDFAAANGIEYVIMDEGWAVKYKADLLQVIPEIDMEELCRYAASKNVGIVLWAGYLAFDRDMERVCEHYSKLGVKGYKIDFLDRDDQYMVDFTVRACRVAAKYHQFIDFHGVFKPAGLTKTFPNALNFEAIHGMEQIKWKNKYGKLCPQDQVKYEVTLPYTRMFCGPADYTQGAMRNAIKKNWKPVYSEPISQGTRVRQLALYIILDAPFTMLCDNPCSYMAEPECTGLIASFPTVWDETGAIDGTIGKYASMWRRNGNTWYVGGINDWNETDRTVSLDFLPEGKYSLELWRDGVNADRAASDYRKEPLREVDNKSEVNVHLAPGGGFVMVLKAK